MSAGCRNVHYDLVFLLDGSSSVGKGNFQKVREWVSNLVGSFDTGRERTRIGVVRYSDSPHTEFELGSHFAKEDVKRAAHNIKYTGGNTRTGDAISYITKHSFSEEAGARPHDSSVNKVLVLLTDGRSQDWVLEPAKEARAAGVRVFAIGVGEAMREELEEMASEPLDAHVFHVSDFDAIDKLRDILRRRICETVICPNLQIEKMKEPGQFTQVPGFDLMERFELLDQSALKETRGPKGHTSLRLGSVPLVQLTEHVFPQGLPDEYTFLTTFRFRKTSKTDDWYIWQVIDKYGIPQVSIRLDGANRALEFNAIGLLKAAVRAVFRGPQVSAVFDRSWHKIGVSVQQRTVSLYVDCHLVGASSIEERENIDIVGKTVIGKRLYDSTPVEFDLQKMVIYCDPKFVEAETCCELPGSQCGPEVEFLPTQTPQVHRTVAPTPAEGVDVITAVNCSCPPGPPGTKGERGDGGLQGPVGPKGGTGAPGPAGLLGIKGEKGEAGRVISAKGDVGQKGDTGQPGLAGARGERGAKGALGPTGLPGRDGKAGEKGELGQKGEMGSPGAAGLRGPPGADGKTGPPGLVGPPGPQGIQGHVGIGGEKGDRGDIGLPGPAGLSGKDGQKGSDGFLGFPGPRGERGEVGPPGQPGDVVSD